MAKAASLSPKSCNRGARNGDRNYAAEINHFQNVALAKGLADSKTVSVDRSDCLFSERDTAAIIDSTGACLRILSHQDLQIPESMSRNIHNCNSLQEDREEEPIIDKKSYVNAELIG